MQSLAALIWLKSRLWWNGLRSRASVADTAVAVILAGLGAVLSFGLAFSLSVITHVGLSDGTTESVRIALLIVFWMLGFLAVVVPVFFGFGQPQVPVARLQAFPLNHWQLYRISLAASFASGVHVFWYPVLTAVTVVAIVVDGAPAFRWLAEIAVFAVCLVVWCNTVLTLVQQVLRRRKIRELAALVGLVLVVMLSMLPLMLEEEAEEQGQDWFGELIPKPVTSAIGGAASVFPPSIVARSLGSAISVESRTGVAALLWLALWTGAGLALGYRIFRRNLLDGNQSTRVESAAAPKPGRVSALVFAENFRLIPVEIRAVAAKELRYLLRSTPGKFNIVIMPLFMIVMALVVARDLDHAFLGLDRVSLVFVGLMIYASMFSNNFLFNAYAWEGAGVQSYFLSPVPPERIVLGKNLGVWLYNVVLGLEGVIAFCLMSGVPPMTALIAGCSAFVAALLSATIVGNFLSPAMPVSRDIASITNSPSQTAVLVTFGVLIANVLLIGGFLTIPTLLGAGWLGPLLLLMLVAVEVGMYSMMLRPAGRLLETRRESLVEALQI